MNKIELIKPDDWHVHFREGLILEKLVPETSKLFNRAIVMPNLKIPITNSKHALNYKNHILKFSKNNNLFKPLLTFYLNKEISQKDLINAFKNNIIFAVKLYPAGATTNSSKGVKKISEVFNILETMEQYKIPLLIHGEVNDKNVDIFDREKKFIENELPHIYKNFPTLKVTLEHITTSYAVNFINETSYNIKASITPHHLILNRTNMLEHKIKPHYYCLPILKREEDRIALFDAACNKNQKYFMGTDSAPHDIKNKEHECGCAGIFNTINSIQMLAQIFDNNNKLERLENFISKNGPLHYDVNPNVQKIILQKQIKPLTFPSTLNLKNQKIKVFKPDFDIFWNILNEKV